MSKITVETAIRALREVAGAVLDTVREAGEQGAPESALYLALTTRGMSHEIATEIIGAMVATGKVRRVNHVLYYVK